MSKEFVSHREIANFADQYVNLKREDAKALRAQVNGLREKLTKYISEHPTFALKKMLLSGSLAKGTALKDINDIDVALYVDESSAPSNIQELIAWLVEKLREAYPNKNPNDIKPQNYSVCISFRGTGLDVDVVPVLYDGNSESDGYLISQFDGSKLLTNIPKHIQFIRNRKSQSTPQFGQMIRLIKFWIKEQKKKDHNFKFKSFMAEMCVAKMFDEGLVLNDYPEALAEFFTRLSDGFLDNLIAFDDYYSTTDCTDPSMPISILDPVNKDNNVGLHYNNVHKRNIEDAAADAADAIDYAMNAVTKGETVRAWKKVLGSSFRG